MNFLKALGVTTAFFASAGTVAGVIWLAGEVFGKHAPLALLFLIVLLLSWFFISVSSHKQPWQ